MPTDAACLTVDDLEVLAAEASRQNLSLACLIGAMSDGSPILWCAEQAPDVSRKENFN